MKKLMLFIAISLITVSSTLAAPSDRTDIKYKIGPILNQDINVRNKTLQASVRAGKSSRSDLVKVIVSLGDDYLSELAGDLINKLSNKVVALGGHIGDHAYNNVQVWIPYDGIETLALWPKIKIIFSPIEPGSTGITSAGLPYIGAPSWQKIGVTGRGVNVGVIDLGFKGYSALLGTELPTSVNARYFGERDHFYSNVHGAACAEIVHDVAPDASIALLDAGDMSVGFHRAVSWMKSNDIDVASSSIGLNLKTYCILFHALVVGLTEVPFGQLDSYFEYLNMILEQQTQRADQVVATVKNAVQNNITWVQAAGNDGQKRWSGRFFDTDGDGYHNFSSRENYNFLTTEGYAGQELYVTLMWGEISSADDYDLLLFDENNKFITKSAIPQSLIPISIESIKFTVASNTNYKIAIKNYSGVSHELLLLVGHKKFPKLKYYNADNTVKLNQPAPVSEAITVGALVRDSVTKNITIAPYSSQGPGENGVMKPDVVAPAGVETISYGDRIFHGTSAAAPHVAGLCALLKQKYPNDTPAQLKTFLLNTAIDYGIAGPDNTYGSGLAYLPTGVFNQPILYFPCIAASPGDTNTVGIINTGRPLNMFGKLKAFNDLGSELASKEVALTPDGRQEFIVENDFSGISNISYLALNYTGGKASGYMSNKTADLCHGYSIPAVDKTSDGDMFVPHIASDEVWNTEVSLLNVSNISKNISIKFDNGTIKNLTISPKENKRFRIRDFFSGVAQPSIHSAKLIGASGFVGTEVFSGGNYAGGISLEPNIQKNVYFPHVASDEQWWTGLVVYNPSIYNTNLSIIPFSSCGVALPIKSVTLPGESKYIGTAKSLALPSETAWFKIESTMDIHSFELFGTADGKQMAGYSTTGIKAERAIFPKLNKEGGWTGIAFINPNDTPVGIVIIAYDDSGLYVKSNSFDLAAHGKIAESVENLFSIDKKDFDPATLNNASYVEYLTIPFLKIIGFQLNASANGMRLEGIPALSVK